MKEIGGYFSLEEFSGSEFYNGIAFNTSRNALRYIIQKRNIQKIYIPIYLCEVVYEACLAENIEVEFYHVDKHFLPILDKNINGYVFVVNYFGIIANEKIKKLNEKYKNIIIDNTQSFFQKTVDNVDTIYNCRKYFGVPDGSYLCTNLNKDLLINTDNTSRFRFKHLLGRYETSGNEFYQEFIKADDSFRHEDIKYMSNLTHNILRVIDYKEILKIRKENIHFLHKNLKQINKILLNINNLTFMYPLYLPNGSEIRNKLIMNKIYVPKMWPNIPKNIELSNIEFDYINNIVFLPIDQRYDINDMKKIIKIINME